MTMGAFHQSRDLAAVLAKTPIMLPPQGIKSNFIDPPSRAETQIVVSSVVLAFVLPFVINRIYVKLLVQKRVTWDDGEFLKPDLGSKPDRC
jgi:hypothetical protein